MGKQQNLRCNVNTCIIYMINEVKHVLLLLHLEPNHRKRKTTRLEKKSTLSQRYSYVTLASKNYSWKFCYITIEILFWSRVIVFDAGTISLVYFSVPVTSTLIELQIVSSSVWIFFSKGVVVRYFFPKFSIAALCSIPWEYVFCYKWQHEVNVCSRFAMFRAWFDRRFVFRVMGNL